MAIWSDTIASVLTAINAQAIYNTTRTTTPNNLGLVVFNQAQDYLCMYKPWRDLQVLTQLTLSSDRKITMPDDYGCCIEVYTDPANLGKPMYWYYLNHNDIAMRYTEEVTIDSTTGTRTIKFAFASTVYIPQNPYVRYSKVLADATQAEVNAATKKSFFPINIMLVAAKLILQDYYGVAANQEPTWIFKRLADEIKMFQAYAYANNTPLDMAVKDRYGNPVYIQGMGLDGGKPRLNRPTPFVPSTLFTGGTM
jgi:hypothetical protein